MPIKPPFFVAYALVLCLTFWAFFGQNYEFVIYALASAVLVGLVQWADRKFNYSELLLWGVNLWLIMHILGGLLVVGDGVLYSFMLFPLVGEPYSILKYDQIVHAYCYFIVALLLWPIVRQVAKKSASFPILATITVLAATGIGGLNEIVEFLAVVLVPETNVGGYENTVIDIICNLTGAILAVLFFKKK